MRRRNDKSDYSPLLGAALLICLTVGVYLPSLNGGFILDDDLLLTNNAIVKAPNGLQRIWFSTEPVDYWPLTNTSFWLEWRVWGMSSTGYHLTNLVLHIGAAFLIWAILRQLAIPGAFFAALLFAIHPVNVESVAWIAQRKNTLAMLFFLLSILWYLFALQRQGAQDATQGATKEKGGAGDQKKFGFARFFELWYLLSLSAFALAMLSKGSVAVLPVMLLGVTWWNSGRISKADGLRIAPFFIVAALLTSLNVWFQTHGSGETVRTATFFERLAEAGATIWFYLAKDLLPINLMFIYPGWKIDAGQLRWWLPLLAAALLTIVLYARRRNRSARALLFGWGFFCVALIPVMGFIDTNYMEHSLVADHYQQIALIGVVVLAGAGWSRMPQNTGSALSPKMIAPVAITMMLALLTWKQNTLYESPMRLYREVVSTNPDSWFGRNLMAKTLIDAGELPEAIEQIRESLRIRPNELENCNLLGVTLVKVGRLQEALDCFSQALKIDPKSAESHFNFAVALIQAGRPQEAIEHFQQAIQFKPDYADAHNDLALALLNAGQLPEAIKHFEEAQKLAPQRIEYSAALAIAYARLGRFADAMETGQKALDLAKSQHQEKLARQIDAWLISLRANLSNAAKDATPPSSTPSN